MPRRCPASTCGRGRGQAGARRGCRPSRWLPVLTRSGRLHRLWRLASIPTAPRRRGRGHCPVRSPARPVPGTTEAANCQASGGRARPGRAARAAAGPGAGAGAGACSAARARVARNVLGARGVLAWSLSPDGPPSDAGQHAARTALPTLRARDTSSAMARATADRSGSQLRNPGSHSVTACSSQ